MATTKPKEDLYERYKRLVPRSQDLTLILLKGHLLVEEQIRAYLEGLLRQPHFLKDTRLTFFQRLRLVQAMSRGKPDSGLWNLIEGINTLRNELSHHAEVESLDQKVDRLNSFFAEDGFKQSKTPRERATRLRHTFAFALGLLSGRMETHLKILRDMQDKY